MDDLNCNGEVVAQTLRELNIINTRLGGNKISINALAALVRGRQNEVLKLADLGCGGGDMIRLFSDWAVKNHYHLEITGVDANVFIIDHARKNLRGVQNVTFRQQNILSGEFARQKFDIIHC